MLLPLGLQLGRAEGMCWGELGVTLQLRWLKYPACHYTQEAEGVSGRVRVRAGEGKPGVWRTVSSRGGHYVLLVPLTHTWGGADWLKVTVPRVGCPRGSYHITTQRFQFGTLMLTHSVSSALLPSLHCLHSLMLIYGDSCHFH